ncbi:MAG: hypothetical protein ACK5Q5_18645, partial [Planctomycetaceae bacterium]
DRQQSQILFTTQLQPLTSLRVQSPDRNFSRRVTVQRERNAATHTGWEEVATGEIRRFDFRSLQREQLVLEFGETRAARYRLVIDNRDSPPLSIKEIGVRGPVEEVVFLAQTDGVYSLGYGGNLRAPQYDTAALTAALRETKTTTPATLAQSAAPLALPPPSPINNPWLLATVILLLMAALAWALYQAAGRVDQLDRANDGTPAP